jgi:hypothetical protein
MSKHLVLGTLVVGVLVYVLWNPVGALLFGGPAFSSGAAGEWVGTMEISNGYDPARMGDTPGPHKQAAIYFKLESTDRFMDAYGGSGEFFIAGETEPRPLRIGAFTLHLPNTNVSTAFISPHFLDATLDHSSYSNCTAKYLVHRRPVCRHTPSRNESRLRKTNSQHERKSLKTPS